MGAVQAVINVIRLTERSDDNVYAAGDREFPERFAATAPARALRTDVV
jgi:hypothetical protein